MGLLPIFVVAFALYAYASRRRLRWALKRMVVLGDVPSRPIDVATEEDARREFLATTCTCKRPYVADSLRATTVRFADENRFVLRAECASCIQERTRYYRRSAPDRSQQ